MRHPPRDIMAMRFSNHLLLVAFVASAFVACASDPPPAPMPQPTLASPLASLPTDPTRDAGASPADAAVPTPAEAIRSALAAPDRDEKDRVLDAQRHPAEMLSFFGIAPGQKVGELVAGGGYTTEILARVVGERGEVFAENPRFILDKFAAKPWGDRMSKPIMTNVRSVERELESPFPPEAHDLDAVLIVLFYHDTVWMKTDRAKMNKAVFDALKQGGVYGIVDHSGRAGSGTTEAQTLHRIDEKTVIDEVTKAGFKLEAEGEFLRNAGDKRDWNDSPMAAGSKRGTSDRFVLKFVKP
jgi:predicted methyltransferase